METFILIIFWLIVVYYAFKLGIRYLLPWIVGRYIRRMQRNMHNYNQQHQQGSGDMNVKYTSQEDPKINPEVGEYVDFEEIKDNNKTE
jgi:hypothetical protein